MQNMQNYMTEYVGTAADPALQEVMKSGKTVIPLQELEYAANDNARTAIGFRTRAGMPTEGVVRPQLVNVSNERTSVEQRLEQIQNEFNALVAANPGVRPADIPGIKELYKEQKTLTKVKDKLEEQAANLQKAVMYEDYMDARVRPIGEQALVEDINPTELQRFPMIPTNKELMYQMYVPDAFKDLGREIVNKLEAGLITPEAAKNLSVPTAVKMKAELIAKREKLAQEAAKLETQQLTSYIIEETQTLPQDGQYGKGTVVKFDATLSKDQMERALSSECEWMDHCIGRAGTPDDRVLSRKAKALGPGNVGSDDKYVGYIPMIASHKPGRVVPKGSSGTQTSYMKEFLEGKAEGRSFRDTATGVPFATMKLYKVEDGEYAGKYRMGEFYGYKDRQVDGPWYEGREGGYSVAENKEYRQVVADWANDHADQLKPISNDHLYKYASVYDGQSLDHKNVLAHVLGVKPEQINDIVQQVGKRFVTEDEAKAAKNALREAPTNELEALKETKADLERALRNGNFMDDEEEMVLRGQLVDITDEIRDLQQRGQVVPQQIEQVREYMTWINDRYPNTQERLAQITEDLNDLSSGVVQPSQHDLRTMADTEAFIRALGDEQRRLLAEQDQLAAQVDDLDTELFRATVRIRENYNDTIANVVDSIITDVNNDVGSINDNPRQWIDTLRQDSLNYANLTREALDRLADTLETAYTNQQPAQNTTVRPEAINFLANDIVVPNAAFRDQTVEDIATSIRNQLLPTIEQYNPTIPNDREALQRDLQFYQTSPLDAALGQGIELYISSNPSQENRIRESVADFMIQQIENRLGNRAPAPAQLPATTDAYTTVRRAHTYLVEAGDIEAMEGIANNIMTNQNGPYAQLTDNERTALRAQLEEGIRDARANQEPTPLSDVIQMDLNRIVDNYDEEVYNEVQDALSVIGQEYDLDIDPALYIYRVRQHADAALRNNDTTMNSIYENLASQLTRTLRENDAIYDARDRINAGEFEPAEDPGLALPVPATRAQNGPEAYRDQYTNEEMGSRRAFDQIIQAERMTPGAINEAIRRTDGRAMYDAEVMQFYNVLAPAGISQINNALRRYMEGNGFDVPPRPAPTNQEALSDILDEALETSIYNYPDNIVDVMQRDIDTIMTEGIRFDRNPMDFIRRLNQLSEEAAATGLEGDATYALAMNELAQSLLYSYQQLPDTPGNAAPQGRKRGGLVESLTGVRSYSDLKRDAFNKKYYDDGQAALDFELRHGTKSDKLGIPYKKYPDYSEEDIIAPKSDEYLNFRHQNDLKRGGRVRRMNSGGVNKVRPTPDIPATPAKQNPNTTDYVPNKPVDPGFKETLERVRKTSSSEPLHPLVEKGVAEGRISRADARWLSDYVNTPGSSKVGTGSSSMPDQSQRMENFLNRVRSGEVQNPYPAEQRQPISKDLTGSSSFTREQLREQALRDSTISPRGGGVSGGGSGLTDTELKNRLGSRNPTYRAGGSISIDEMKYALMKGR